jgi:phosphoribosylformylglycinamidine synthase subunit PurS
MTADAAGEPGLGDALGLDFGRGMFGFGGDGFMRRHGGVFGGEVSDVEPNRGGDRAERKMARVGVGHPATSARIFGGEIRRAMKAKIVVTPKRAVVDPQGKTVQGALVQMGYEGIAGVHVGRYLEVDLVPGTDPAAARRALDEACHRFLSNPVIEDYRLEIQE